MTRHLTDSTALGGDQIGTLAEMELVTAYVTGHMGAAPAVGRMWPLSAFAKLPFTNNIDIPLATSSGIGAITKDGSLFFHNYSAVAPATGVNTFAGVDAGNLTLTAVSSTGFGHGVLRDLTSGNLNSAFGTRALTRVTTGAVNSAFGAEALTTLTTGGYNNAFGCKALGNTTTGWRNNAFGQWVLPQNTTGEDNCAVGVGTMVANLSGNANCVFGNGALTSSVAVSSICAFGTNALYNANGGVNNAFGRDAMYTTSTGSGNNGFGYQCLYYNTTGNNNAAFGDYTIYNNSTGNHNAAYGHRAGYGAAGDEATTVDTYCTFVGTNASRSSATPTATVLTNSTALGNDAKFTKSNQVVLGNAAVEETIIRGVQRGTVFTVAGLPSAATVGAGSRAFVSDANATTFASVVASGGSNGVPVYSDGTNWRIG